MRRVDEANQPTPLWRSNDNPSLFLKRAEEMLTIALQPLVDLGAGSAFGYEALVRDVARLGFDRIADLFDHAFRIGVLSDLDLLLTEKAIDQFLRLGDTRWRLLFVNLDGRSLPNLSEIAPAITRLLRKRGLEPADLCIELSEANQVLTGEALERELARLRAGGFQIALDDFGAGFSGLKMLYESNPGFIKIDRFFVSDLEADPKKRLFVGAVVKIARSMGVKVIAEGVETARENQVCRELGCDLVQGYFAARPSTTPEDLPRDYAEVASGRDDACETAGLGVRRLVEPYVWAPDTATLGQVLAAFEAAPSQSVLPVLNRQMAPVGCIREVDLKPFVYARFGRELLTNRALDRQLGEFVRPIVAADVNTAPRELIDLTAAGAEDGAFDGVILTENMRYLGYLPAAALVRIANAIQIGEVRRQNPLTLLPGNDAIQEFMAASAARSGEQRLFAYFDFDNFKPLNDAYGFGVGDRAIRMFADMLRASLVGEEMFIGHIGGDDFFVGAVGEACARAEAQLRPLCERFGHEAESLYSTIDRFAGHIVATCRDGVERRFPLLSCSVGMVTLPAEAPALTAEEVSRLLADAKKQAKLSGEHYAERRLAPVADLERQRVSA